MSLEPMGGREDKVLAETLIKSLPHLFFSAVEQSSEAVVITDARGNIEYVNPAFTRITGYTREETLGQNHRLLKSGEHDPELYRELWKTILTGASWRGELINRRKDGSFYAEEMHIAPVCNPHGEVTHFIATQQDATTRRQLEQQLKWVQTVEAVGRLAGGVVHELNNLLAIISGYGQLLQGRVNPEGLGAVEEILKAAERAAALTRQLLSFSRGQILAPEVLDLNLVVSDTLKMLRLLVGDGIELATIQQADLGQVMADRGQIEQAIMHLTVNARDAMPKGGALAIHMENVTFDEVYAGMNLEAKPGPYVCIKVEDTGTGIPKAIQDKIFDPFFTTKALGKGTGLGLSTTLAIVKSHGGFINYHSAPGKGTVFEVYFPANTTLDDAEDAKIEQSKLPRGQDELVLVVDDEEPIRNLAQKVLTRFGYRVLLAADGAEAVSLYAPRRKEIDVVITDMAMPIMDGPATIIALKAINSEVKIISSTGLASDGGMAMAKNAGIQHFIPKPYTAETMLNTLHEVLHGNSEN